MYLADIELNHHNRIDSFKRVKYSLWERLNSSMEVCGDFLVIFGGRKSPAVAMNDVIKVRLCDEGCNKRQFSLFFQR